MFTEGLNILLNIFFGISINAARGIAVQVQGVIARFIVSFQTALNPQITKSYASGDLSYMHRLIYTSSKFSFFLLVLLSLPVFLETENLLRWWLKTVPDHTVNFVRIMLLISLIDCLANPLVLAAKATGNIKIYQLLTGGVLLLIVPVSYLGLRLGFSSEYVFIVHLLISIIAQGIRVLLVRKLVGIRLREYFRMVVLRVLVVVVVSSVFPLWVHLALAEGVLRFLLVGGFSAISVLLAVFFLGITKYEKELLMVQVRNGIIKLKYSYK
jgi:O-antigen/teichoic acid export membrane protein